MAFGYRTNQPGRVLRAECADRYSSKVLAAVTVEEDKEAGQPIRQRRKHCRRRMSRRQVMRTTILHIRLPANNMRPLLILRDRRQRAVFYIYSKYISRTKAARVHMAMYQCEYVMKPCSGQMGHHRVNV